MKSKGIYIVDENGNSIPVNEAIVIGRDANGDELLAMYNLTKYDMIEYIKSLVELSMLKLADNGFEETHKRKDEDSPRLSIKKLEELNSELVP